jgi:hypothetical protein
LADPLIPPNVVVTIAGSVLTTHITNYKESGGETNFNSDKTLNRRYKLTRGKPNDWSVSFQGTAYGSQMDKFYQYTDNPPAVAISIAWTGSYTVTYNGARIRKNNLALDADGRLIFDAEFTAPFYNVVGSKNRVVS